MPNNPIPCQSLGNTFYLFEKQAPEKSWPQIARELCTSKKLDGILILHHTTPPTITMFNSDGSNGQLCLNGARCVAHHLHTKQSYPNKFDLQMGDKIITHLFEDTKDNGASITQYIPMGIYEGEKKITSVSGYFLGHAINVGNPHFVIFEKREREWVKKNGHHLEQHESFPNQTNIEFVWPTGKDRYAVLAYERGCGVTQACSSGAAAITQVLYEKGLLQAEQKIELCMLGGVITTTIAPASRSSHILLKTSTD